MTTHKTPLISVLMTCYNREKYLGDAIESVLKSTFQDFELIIVDDNSIDRSLEIAQSYAEKDDRIQVYRNDENLGDYPNRNRAASYAQGKYLKYLDSDDLIYPWTLEIMFQCMEKFPEAALGIVYEKQDDDQPFPFSLSPEASYRYNYFKNEIFMTSPLFAMIKREAFDELKGFTEQRMISDVRMWHRLSQRFPLVLMPSGCVWLRSHDEQEMNDYRTDAAIPLQYLLLESNVLSSSDNPLNKEQKDLAIRIVKRKIAKSVILTALRDGPYKAYQLMKMAEISLFDIFNEVVKKKILKIEYKK